MPRFSSSGKEKRRWNWEAINGVTAVVALLAAVWLGVSQNSTANELKGCQETLSIATGKDTNDLAMKRLDKALKEDWGPRLAGRMDPKKIHISYAGADFTGLATKMETVFEANGWDANMRPGWFFKKPPRYSGLIIAAPSFTDALLLANVLASVDLPVRIDGIIGEPLGIFVSPVTDE